MEVNKLQELVECEIREKGPITFRDFMELALYHPELGYYNTRVGIGKAGDFYTAPHVHELFGRLVAKQLREMWDVMGRPSSFLIVEMGGGHGYLASDILDFAEQDSEFSRGVQYIIIERSPKLRTIQEERLGERATWFSSLSEIPGKPFPGCIVANEFVDSLPVHRVRMSNGALMEVYIDAQEGRLVEKTGTLSRPELAAYFDALGFELAEGSCAEVNLEMLDWISEVGRQLGRGFVMVIDYGYPASLLYNAAGDGTIRAYRSHRLDTSYLESPGEKDITCHVDFTSLSRAAEAIGLVSLGLTDQSRFLFGIGEEEIHNALVDQKGAGIEQAKARGRIVNLVHPDMMGGAFKVLILCRGVGSPRLCGLKNARITRP